MTLSRRPRIMLAVAVALLAAAVYANSLRNGFALDDEAIIRENEWVHGLDKLSFAVDSAYWPKVRYGAQVYRPVATASYVLNWAAAGDRPMSWHLVNVVLHAGVTAVLLAFLLQLGAPLGAAAVGAALFAVHPVHTEAVANVVGRAELFCALFYLLACIVYLRRTLHPALRLPLLALCFLFSLGSKEMGVTLPGVLLLLEASRSRSVADLLRRVRDEVPAFVVLAAAAAAYLLLRQAAIGHAVGDLTAPELQTLSAAGRLATAVRLWPEYLRLMLFPRDLVADYAPDVIRPVDRFDALAVAALAIGVLLVVLALRTWRSLPLLSLGIAWFAITVFPVSNLVVPVGVLVAERTLYLPSVGVALAAAAAATLLANDPRVRRPLALGALAVLLLLGAYRTWTRNPTWRSTGHVIRALAQHHPESFRVQWLHATTLMARGDEPGALRAYESALQMVPNHYNLLVEFGGALLRLGHYDRAAEMARRAQRLLPGYTEPYLVWSSGLMYQGRHEEAIAVLHEGLGIVDVESGRLYDNLAYAYAERGMWQPALHARRASLAQASPRGLDRQRRDLARILERLGRPVPPDLVPGPAAAEVPAP